MILHTTRVLAVVVLVLALAFVVVLGVTVAHDHAPARNAVSGVTGSVDASGPVIP